MKQIASRIWWLLTVCQEPLESKMDAFLVALIGAMIFACGLALILLMHGIEGG